MTALDDLAAQVHALQKQVTGLTRPSQLANSSIEQAGETLDLADAASTAVGLPATIAGLQEILDTNEETLAAVRIDVQAAIDAAQEASDAGVAAGELANEAADNALEKAQEALDAAAAAGGGATYSGSAPTPSTPGVPGQQWFVWDSTYKINAYYVYDGATSAWVQTEITDAVLGNISAGSITSGYLGAERIAAASLTAAVLAADTLTSREIGADAILARNIKAAEITGDKIAARTIAAGNIVAGTITGNEIKANSITADQIAANSITANEINLDSLNGKTLTGATIRSAATGQRSEIVSNNISFYASSNAAAGAIAGVLTTWNNIDYAAVSIGGGSGGCLIHNPIPYYPAPTGLGPLQVTMTNARDAMIRKVLLNTSVGAYAGVYYPDGTNVYPIIHPSGGFADGWTVTAEKFNVTTVLPNGTTSPTYQTAIARTFVNGAFGVVVTADDFRRPDGTTILPAAGTANYNSSVAAGGNATVAVTFPPNRFASAPVVVCTPSNGRFTAAVTSITKTGFSISLTNVTSAAGTPGNVNWIAQPAG